MQLVWDVEGYVRTHVQTFRELFGVDLSDVEVKGHREHVKECIRDQGVSPTAILVDENEKDFVSKFCEGGRGLLFTTGRRPRTIYVVTTLDNQLKYGKDQGQLEVAAVHDLTHVFFRELVEEYTQRYEEVREQYSTITPRNLLCFEGLAEIVSLELAVQFFTSDAARTIAEERKSCGPEGELMEIFKGSEGKSEEKILEGCKMWGTYFVSAMGLGLYTRVFEELGKEGVLAVPSLPPQVKEYIFDNVQGYVARLKEARFQES